MKISSQPHEVEINKVYIYKEHKTKPIRFQISTVLSKSYLELDRQTEKSTQLILGFPITTSPLQSRKGGIFLYYIF